MAKWSVTVSINEEFNGIEASSEDEAIAIAQERFSNEVDDYSMEWFLRNMALCKANKLTG